MTSGARVSMSNRSTLMERSVPGRRGAALPDIDVPIQPMPDQVLLRQSLEFPEITEPEVVRYFTLLSRLNYSIDTNFYPLGSCTMKYNPKLHDEMAFMPGFAGIHPLQPQFGRPGRSQAAVQAPDLPCGNHRHGSGEPGLVGRRPG